MSKHSFVPMKKDQGTNAEEMVIAPGGSRPRSSTTPVEPGQAVNRTSTGVLEVVSSGINMKADGSLEKIFGPFGHCLLPGPYAVTTGPLPAPSCPAQAP